VINQRHKNIYIKR